MPPVMPARQQLRQRCACTRTAGCASRCVLRAACCVAACCAAPGWEQQQQKQQLQQAQQAQQVFLPGVCSGDLLDGVVCSIRKFGALVELPQLSTVGLLHISQMSKGHVESVANAVAIGETLKALVLKVRAACVPPAVCCALSECAQSMRWCELRRRHAAGALQLAC